LGIALLAVFRPDAEAQVPKEATKRHGMKSCGLTSRSRKEDDGDVKSREFVKQQINKIREDIKRIPGIKALIKTTAFRILRFKITLLVSQRQNRTITRFLRMPTQFEALSGPVLDFLLKNRAMDELKVIVMGCSIGAEPYSIASILRKSHPDLVFTIYAYDIDQGCIDRAKSVRYKPEEVLNNELITSDFVDNTFDKVDGDYVVKNDIRKHVRFDVADALDTNLREKIGTSDIVFAQHFLTHLKHKQAVKGFRNICHLLNPKAALFISGMELDMLVKLTRENNLVPCEYKVEEIYKEAGILGKGWPYSYWGREPFMMVRKDWQRRYSTIFLKT
jgi:chemotaxis protein methyltransferase CheR